MRILVVGSGGREHALVWKLSQEAAVYCTPGNAGIAQDCECFDVKVTDQAGIGALCHRLKPDLVVIGPEDPLVQGLASFLRAENFAVFGPEENAAQLEASKAWSKKLMHEAGVPTAEFGAFTDAEAALDYATQRFQAGRQVAVKASGNALGKGVIVCSTLDEAEDAIAAMLVEREFGEAGATVVIEDRLVGPEFSLLTVVSGRQFKSLPVAQDYKRALDGNRGPNTGGMGTRSPAKWVTEGLVTTAEETIVKPMVELLADKGIEYRGVLFSGILVQDGVPMCLEYNVRFGDPETQSVVRRIGAGFADLLYAAATGAQLPDFEVNRNAVVTVILASGGYPGNYKKGVEIAISDLPETVKVFHAGTATKDGNLVTAGGRVLGVSAEGNTTEEARAVAYKALDSIHFDGATWRTDIGAEELA